MGEVSWPSIPAMLRERAAAWADREALVGTDERLTFHELRARVDEVARSLVGLGVAPGDAVAIWAPNTTQWPVAALAALSCGASLVPVNTRYRGHEALDLLRRSRARVLFTVTDFLGVDLVAMLRGAADDGGDRDGSQVDTAPFDGIPVVGLRSLQHVVVLSGATPPQCLDLGAFAAAGGDVATAEVDRRVAAIGPDDVSDIMFTSGTTGRSKGVVATHGQSLRVFETWSRLVGLREDDRYLVVNPFFHTFGYKAGFLSAIMRGAATVPHAVYDADSVLRRIGEERISMLPGAPALYQGLLAHPDLASHDIGSLRLAVTGAASIPVSLVERMHAELGFDVVLTAYGLTEATGVVTMCREGDDPTTIATTSGRAIDGVEVRIVDGDGRTLPAGEPGEVLVRGHNVMRGYFEEPERTAETIDGDGWLHTGDVGVLDDRGYLDITDRIKDMFIVGGFNAYPAEIEHALLEHPAIAQVAVVGMPEPRLGEVGWAFVVSAPDAVLDPDEVIAWARGRMANFKAPRRVVALASLPTNASGKVLKHELRALAVDEEAGR